MYLAEIGTLSTLRLGQLKAFKGIFPLAKYGKYSFKQSTRFSNSFSIHTMETEQIRNYATFKSQPTINQTHRTNVINHLRSLNGCYSRSLNFGSKFIQYRSYSTSTADFVKQQETAKNVEPDPNDPEARAKAWKKMKLSLIIAGTSITISFFYALFTLGTPDKDEEGNTIVDEFSNLPPVAQLVKRFIYKIRYFTKVIKEPSQTKLLPDPLQYPYIQPPYTVVLELTDLLVHPDWTYKTGWRFKKRPNVDYFLDQCAPPLFELVVFTAEQAITVFPIINQLDKNGAIAFRLVRDSTDFIDGHHVKNLDWLNRDLKRVIVVDWNSESVKLHPNNAFVLPRWDGSDEDQALIDLAAFLKTIAVGKVDDVREVLAYYRQFENPLEQFKENQRKLMEQLEEQERMEQEKKKNPPLTSRYAKSFSFRG